MSRGFEVHNLHHRVTDFVETFFPSLNFFLIRPVWRGQFLPVFFFFCIILASPALSRTRDHRTSLPGPFIERQYRVLEMHAVIRLSFIRSTGCTVQNWGITLSCELEQRSFEFFMQLFSFLTLLWLSCYVLKNRQQRELTSSVFRCKYNDLFLSNLKRNLRLMNKCSNEVRIMLG